MRKLMLIIANVLFLFSLTASAQMNSFVGRWTNTDTNTAGVTKINVTKTGNNAFVRFWGQCSPRDCDWGRVDAKRYFASTSSNRVLGLMGNFSSNGIRRMVILKMLRGNILQAQVITRYSGGSRKNTIRSYTFRKLRQAVLRTPKLVSPENNVRLTNFPRTTTLDWRPVSGATAYGVEVQYYDRSSRRWVKNYITKKVTNTSHKFNFVGDQAGRWRVWAIRENKLSRKSAWRTFSYRTSSAILRAPALTSPRNGIVYNRFPRTTTLNWRRVGGASHYMVEVQYYDRGSRSWKSNYILAKSTDTRHVFKFVGAQPGRWRVWAVSVSGKAGRKSDWRTFKYTR